MVDGFDHSPTATDSVFLFAAVPVASHYFPRFRVLHAPDRYLRLPFRGEASFRPPDFHNKEADTEMKESPHSEEGTTCSNTSCSIRLRSLSIHRKASSCPMSISRSTARSTSGSQEAELHQQILQLLVVILRCHIHKLQHVILRCHLL